MSGSSHAHAGPTAAQRVADRVKVPGPWEVYAEEARRYEVHLNGTRVELVRGPIDLSGYGVRLFRENGPKSTRTGFQGSTDFSEAGVRATIGDAEAVGRHAEFPAPIVQPSSSLSVAPPAAEILDRHVADDPANAVDGYLAELRNRFENRHGTVVSFGSVKTAVIRTSLVNSAGLSHSFDHTLVGVELAIKASGGPEGVAPGEYWVDFSARRLEPKRLEADVERWCRYAADVRKAVPPPTGELPVVLPPGVLAGIFPDVIGFRATGTARLRKLGLPVGHEIAAPSVTITDQGAFPWSPASGPVDCEGAVSRTTTIVEKGVVKGLLYDALHGSAFGERSTGNSVRRSFGPRPWFSFPVAPGDGSTTLVVSPGAGGSDTELCEAAGDGIWVQQLGWANPDAISGAFGGEIRIGYRIRHGKLAEPVRGGIVGGLVFAPPKAPSLLANVAAVGSTPELVETMSTPALLVRNLTVAGTKA